MAGCGYGWAALQNDEGCANTNSWIRSESYGMDIMKKFCCAFSIMERLFG